MLEVLTESLISKTLTSLTYVSAERFLVIQPRLPTHFRVGSRSLSAFDVAQLGKVEPEIDRPAPSRRPERRLMPRRGQGQPNIDFSDSGEASTKPTLRVLVNIRPTSMLAAARLFDMRLRRRRPRAARDARAPLLGRRYGQRRKSRVQRFSRHSLSQVTPCLGAF